jgi:divalent metal cation (Fe/Co/Zn/Cd) transporter
MRPIGKDLPEDRRGALRSAHHLAWLTLAYLASAILLMAAVLSGSQALKTAWADDMLGLIPPTLFLVGSRISPRLPTSVFPYGFNRAVSAGYLGASVALLGVGGWLLATSLLKLVWREHPSIGSVSLFGHIVWYGWLAIPVLLWSSIPAIFLGRAKRPLALCLNDKVLLADARMNQADWQTGGAAILGILGVAFGFWWADAAAGALISLDIVKDGFTDVRSAIFDLMDRRPDKLLDKGYDPLPERLLAFMRQQDWVKDAAIRMREDGRLFVGEVFVVPRDDHDLTARIGRAAEQGRALDWRLSELVISPVPALPDFIRIAQPTPRRRPESQRG